MKKIFTLLVIVLVILAASQYGPAYLARVSFNESAQEQVKFARDHRKSPEKVRRDLVAKAVELGIAMEPEDIHITRQSPVFTVDIEYIWPITIGPFHQDLTFHFSGQGDIFEQ